MKGIKKAGSAIQWLACFKQKKIKSMDVILAVLAVISITYVIHNSYRFDGSFRITLPLESPWLVKSDAAGNQYIVDKEKSRILQVADGKIHRIIKAGAAKGDTFQSAENISVTSDGTVYVLDTGWSEDGFSITYEAIIKYESKTDPEGELCYRVDYTGNSYDKHRIFGMEVYGNAIYFVSADEEGFSLHSLNTDTLEHRILYRCVQKDAITLIQDFVIDRESFSIYIIDKRGMVFRAAEELAEPKLLYQILKTEGEKTVLYRGTAARGQTVYITDIASGRLLKFCEEEEYQPVTVLESPKMWNVSYYEPWGQEPRLYYVSANKVCMAAADGEVIQTWDKYQKTGGFLCRELTLYLIFAAGVCSHLYLAVRAAMVLTTFDYSSSQKIGALIIVTVLAVSVIIVNGLLGEFKDIYRGELLNKLSMTAQIVSGRIEVGELDRIETSGSFMSEDYKILWNKMNGVVDKKYEYSNDIYCNILRYDGIHGYALAYLDNSIGAYYPLTEEETGEIITVYETGVMLQSDAHSETGSYIYVLMPIFDEKNQVTGVVSVGTLSSVIDAKLMQVTRLITVAIIMIILTIMFLFTETLSFYSLRDRYRIEVKEKPDVPPMHVIRMIVFITFLAFNMATSFLPVYILTFVKGDLGIPAAIANSLPITVNLIIVGLTSIICPLILKKVNVATLAAASSIISFVGDLIMAFSSHYGMILAGLILNGIGVGVITNSLHIFMASVSGKKEGLDGFSIFNAASLSGINCGMLLGSALADRMGQNQVFLVSAFVWAMVSLVFFITRKSFVMKRKQKCKQKNRQKNKLTAVGFFSSAEILKFTLCIQIPYIVMNSFTYYYVPIYGNSQGYSENITSLLIIISSLLTAYLSVAATKYCTKKFKDRSIYLSTVITFAGLLIFAWKMSFPSLIGALVLIGIANSFGSSVRILQFLGKEESRSYGQENAMGGYNFLDNLGESAGSVIFAGILTVGFRTGILGLMTAVMGLNGLYAWNHRKKKADKC